MKDKVNWLFLMMIIFITAACSQESLLDETTSATQKDEYHVSLEQALKNADALFAKLEGETRSTRRMKSVEYFSNSTNTRATEDNADYYVVNYGENDGFAVLGADTRVDRVYAISESGHLEMSDTIENVGLQIFFETLPSISGPDRPKLDTLPALGPVVVDKPKDISYKVGPLLSSSVRKWSQSDPFNLLCPKVYYGNDLRTCPAGCAPVAIGMILTAFNAPNIVM